MKDILHREIVGFVQNRQDQGSAATRWRAPLAGFAAADDPAMAGLHKAVSPSHALPGTLLTGARTVIIYFVPFTEDIARGNIGGRLSSRAWALAYVETNRLLAELGAHLEGVLTAHGWTARATPPTHNFDRRKLMSEWSHRHLAVMAGLGTFGLNNMLITAAGCCGRLGSLVTNAAIEPDPPLAYEACLFRHDGSCRACVARCVNAALFEDAFDRQRCYAMCLENERHYRALGKADVCGKCLVGLPCSTRDPVAARIQAAPDAFPGQGNLHGTPGEACPPNSGHDPL